MVKSEIDRLILILTNDFGGITRGRGFPSSAKDKFFKSGIGWVPANQTITPFDTLGENPFGSHGDLRIVPDLSAEFKISERDNINELQFYLGDIKQLSGDAWSCCTRTFLKTAINDLKEQTGLSLKVAFEHEFTMLDKNLEKIKFGPAFSMESFVEVQEFGNTLFSILQEGGIEPEMFLPEFGDGQIEVPISPSKALVAADRAVMLREITRIVAKSYNMTATFAPKAFLDGVGNGVHVHFSLYNDEGEPVNYDANGVGGLSKDMGAFCAGILSHAEALTAFTAPSVASYYRLKPHHWSCAYSCLGLQNREATLRICPAATPNDDPKSSHHLEFRAADATASPYLVLGSLIRAGLNGIKGNLNTPELLNSDPDDLSDAERKSKGIKALPKSLESSLSSLMKDDGLLNDYDPLFLQSYMSMKNAELAALENLKDNEICRKYVMVY